MKLSPFMKEHKANLKKMSKKQLIQQNLNQIELLAQQDIKNDRLIEYNTQKEQHLRSAENALEYKEKVIEKYKTLLETAVEHL
jgi:hypothetical protein